MTTQKPPPAVLNYAAFIRNQHSDPVEPLHEANFYMVIRGNSFRCGDDETNLTVQQANLANLSARRSVSARMRFAITSWHSRDEFGFRCYRGSSQSPKPPKFGGAYFTKRLKKLERSAKQ